MLQTIHKETLSTQATENKKNLDESPSAGSVCGRGVDGDIKNLSSVIKSTKSKMPIFAKVNSSKTNFLTTGAKKAFIYLRKAFTKASILWHFDLKRYIRIETDGLEYTIGGVFCQMTSGKSSSNHVTRKNHSDFSKSEICQSHLVTFFS